MAFIWRFHHVQSQFSQQPKCIFIVIGRKGDVIESLNIMISELEPVVLWMSNALEMLHYLQCHLNRYLGSNHESSAVKESLASADEELLTVLEEVIMFTFQQTVYHLTKVSL